MIMFKKLFFNNVRMYLFDQCEFYEEIRLTLLNA